MPYLWAIDGRLFVGPDSVNTPLIKYFIWRAILLKLYKSVNSLTTLMKDFKYSLLFQLYSDSIF
jgi:hypothetical protein